MQGIKYTMNQSVILIDCGSTKSPDISLIIHSHGFEPTTISWTDANDWNFTDACAVIISGGPHLLTQNGQSQRRIMEKFKFLRQLNTPTLGICLGHQAIAITFGSEVYRGEERRKTDAITCINPKPLFQHLPDNAIFAEDHCEGIHPSDNMQVLAYSEHYSVEAFKITDRPFFGVQFHPEISGDNGKVLLGNFLNWASRQS